MAKPERLRFTILDDLILLREVSRQNPYEEGDRWKTVAERVVNATQKNFSLRCVKEHVDHLLKIWTREGRAHLKKSGTEEQYNEKEGLLQQIQDLQKEFRRSGKGSNAQKSRIQRDVTLENISDTLEVIIEEPTVPTVATSIPSFTSSTFLPIALPSPTSSSSSSSSTPLTSGSPLQSPTMSPSRTGGPIRNKIRHDALKKSTLHFLQERHKKEVEFQEKQFHLEERRIQLEEEKFKVEKKEREARLELEIEERRQRIAVSKQKQEILEILLQLIHKP
ncbi:myotubularin-related protein DDB_G0290005-like [Mycetomoellerius zeteki]|uniref:myotubularin-related protein DDB_G0290005-like n=1 Tax=Mycetomoellerius zeteki TaxID=64791 RepID=UPI00084EBB84|nr:PREDICTED: myotubularin-related protein DDB_G0290005-like [Trachymyrmex zeteki]